MCTQNRVGHWWDGTSADSEELRKSFILLRVMVFVDYVHELANRIVLHRKSRTDTASRWPECGKSCLPWHAPMHYIFSFSGEFFILKKKKKKSFLGIGQTKLHFPTSRHPTLFLFFFFKGTSNECVWFSCRLTSVGEFTRHLHPVCHLRLLTPLCV